MKIAICEDYKEESALLGGIIHKWAEGQKLSVEIFTFENTASFAFTLEDCVYDVLFLDIQMPGEDGITFAKKLRQKKNNIPIIFVTGLDGYMSEGYEVEAVHYLLKPVKPEKVWECLNRICQRMELEDEEQLILDTPQGLAKLRRKDIIKIEVYGRKCVCTTDGAEYTVTASFKEMAEKLGGKYFVQCYRGILVNVCHIESIGKEQIEMTGKIRVPVSRRMYPQVNQAFIRYYREEV